MILQAKPFVPPPGLTNPHIQTILSSLGRKVWRSKAQDAFSAGTQREVVHVDGVALAIDKNLVPNRPLVMLIPGWLGSSQSSYCLSCAQQLNAAGFSTIRINLRDHGETAHLNEGMFNSALLNEVVSLVSQLAGEYGQNHRAGLVGYSLGGNFALRIARALPEVKTLAICPAIEPASTMNRIDGSAIYQRYFINKWRKVWRDKQAAFPQLYQFGEAMNLNTVSALTDYFVRYHSHFDSTNQYFSAYDLSGAALDGVQATILAAHDDPIIPGTHYQNLPTSLDIHLTDNGGHGAYLDSWQLSSWADQFAVAFFKEQLDPESN